MSGTHHILPMRGVRVDLHPLDVQPVGPVVLWVQDVGAAQSHTVTFRQVQDLLAVPIDPHGGQQRWGRAGQGRGLRGAEPELGGSASPSVSSEPGSVGLAHEGGALSACARARVQGAGSASGHTWVHACLCSVMCRIAPEAYLCMCSCQVCCVYA